MIDFMQKGGPLMWVLLACSVFAVAIFARKMLHFHRISLNVSEFLLGLSVSIRNGNIAEALHEAAGPPGPVARVIHTALAHHDSPRAELREIVREAAQIEVPRLERNLAVLATIAYVAPLIGMLGTVAGLIETFVGMSSTGGYTTATDLSAGIYTSLLTTAAGLMVAVPSYVGFSYLNAWVTTFMHDMERAGIEIVNLLSHKPGESSIIDFDNSRQQAGAGSQPAGS